jgi:glycosyltransferase involved in cell wall biosynthesis
LAEQERADVVQLCSYSHAGGEWDRPTVLTAHSDVLSWWRAVLGEDAPTRYESYRRRVRAGLAAADAVVAVSRAYGRMLHEAAGAADPARCRVIHNGLRPLDCPGGLMAREGVLAVGRFDDAGKNVAVLLAAAEQLGKRLTLIGDGVPAGLQNLTNSPGRLPHGSVTRRLCRAAVFAGPAKYDPFGLAPLEAARAGCALVLADLPTYREIWGDAAVYLDPDDADAWTEALRQALDDPPRCRARATAALLRAQRYRHRTTARLYLDLYRHLLDTPRPRADHATRLGAAG